jgi:hypothetical protein
MQSVHLSSNNVTNDLGKIKDVKISSLYANSLQAKTMELIG